jgi:hypothetical protein
LPQPRECRVEKRGPHPRPPAARLDVGSGDLGCALVGVVVAAWCGQRAEALHSGCHVDSRERPSARLAQQLPQLRSRSSIDSRARRSFGSNPRSAARNASTGTAAFPRASLISALPTVTVALGRATPCRSGSRAGTRPRASDWTRQGSSSEKDWLTAPPFSRTTQSRATCGDCRPSTSRASGCPC